MSKTEKPLLLPTPARVRAILKRAGFSCYRWRTSAIRGWYHYDPGYRVRDIDGVAAVDHQQDYTAPRGAVASNEARYRQVIEAAGYRCVPILSGFAVRMPEAVDPAPRRTGEAGGA